MQDYRSAHETSGKKAGDLNQQPLVATESDVLAHADMAAAMAVIRSCLMARQRQELVAPPRHQVTFADGQIVLTIGGVTSDDVHVAGFRASTTFPQLGLAEGQLTAVWDTRTGGLKGLVLGSRLAALRTGAIGGVAIEAMARQDALVCGVLGTGLQAETQLEAALVARPQLDRILVYSREPANRERFARAIRKRTDREVVIVDHPRRVVSEADILLVATKSTKPVLETRWLKTGVHINSLGPKFCDAHELPILPRDGRLHVATDSPAQLSAYGKPYFLEGSSSFEGMLDLSTVTGEAAFDRQPGDTTLFCSVGLAGTEVLVADDFLTRWSARRA